MRALCRALKLLRRHGCPLARETEQTDAQRYVCPRQFDTHIEYDWRLAHKDFGNDCHTY